jgi:hypothetical protein
MHALRDTHRRREKEGEGERERDREREVKPVMRIYSSDENILPV